MIAGSGDIIYPRVKNSYNLCKSKYILFCSRFVILKQAYVGSNSVINNKLIAYENMNVRSGKNID